MPFDPFAEFHQDKAPSKLLSRARLAELAQALRRPMPVYFRWDYGEVLIDVRDLGGNKCGSQGCAIGLACVLWPDFAKVYAKGDSDEEIEMPEEDINEIFYGGYYAVAKDGEVKPKHVADAIDRYLETGHAF